MKEPYKSFHEQIMGLAAQCASVGATDVFRQLASAAASLQEHSMYADMAKNLQNLNSAENSED